MHLRDRLDEERIVRIGRAQSVQQRQRVVHPLRRPSFDRATGTFYIADVGENTWEEIDIGQVGGLLDGLERGDRRDVHHDEHPRRGLREERLEVDAADDSVDHRQQEVVEQRRPPDEEPEVRVDRLGRVGVRRPRRGVDTRHPSVADRREYHRDQREEVGRLRKRVVPDGEVTAADEAPASIRLPLERRTGASDFGASIRVV